MPRTRINHRTKRDSATKINTSNHDLETKMISILVQNLDTELDYKLSKLEEKRNRHIANEDLLFSDILSELSIDKCNKTLSELRHEKSSTFHGASSFMTSVTKNSTFLAKKKKQTDEATETSRPVSSDRTDSRKARSNHRGVEKAKGTRSSRSLSRTNMKRHVTIKETNICDSTPLEKRMLPPNYNNFVTPKVKANTPIALLRRPHHGEMAISMQGSPLFVNSSNSDHCANVNIPLMDGRVLSLQPNRGLRMSEIPDLDEETRLQLETLRDNINKVVNLVSESCN